MRRRLGASTSRDEAAFGEHRRRGSRRPAGGGSGLRRRRPWRRWPRRWPRRSPWRSSSFPSPGPGVHRLRAVLRVSLLVGLSGVLLLPSGRHRGRAAGVHPAATRGAAVLVLLPERWRLLPGRADVPGALDSGSRALIGSGEQVLHRHQSPINQSPVAALLPEPPSSTEPVFW